MSRSSSSICLEFLSGNEPNPKIMYASGNKVRANSGGWGSNTNRHSSEGTRRLYYDTDGILWSYETFPLAIRNADYVLLRNWSELPTHTTKSQHSELRLRAAQLKINVISIPFSEVGVSSEELRRLRVLDTGPSFTVKNVAYHNKCMHCHHSRKEHDPKTGKCLFEATTYIRASHEYETKLEGEVLLAVAGTSGRFLIGNARTKPHTHYVETMDDVDTVEVALKHLIKGAS